MKDAVATMPDELRNISLSEIVEPWVILRNVDRESLDFLELRDSIADKGLLCSICVRPSLRKPGKMEVVTGLRRFMACRDLERSPVECIVKYNLTDLDVLALQIQENALQAATSPVEYARQLKRIMETVPGMTEAQLSNMVHRNADWIRDQLGLLGLRQNIQKAVERGEIPLGSAYILSRLPRLRQVMFIDLARTVSVREFTATVVPVIKEIKEAARQGKLADFYLDVNPHPYLRAYKEVLAEYQDHAVGGLAVIRANCQSPLDAWYLALQWVLHLDEESSREYRAKRLAQIQAKVLTREDEPCSEIDNDSDNE